MKKYQIITKSYLPTYLCDSNDSSDSSDISDGSDSSDSINSSFFFHQKNQWLYKLYNLFKTYLATFSL